MGFDMHMVRTPKATPEGYEPQYEGQPGYHRFTFRAMPLTLGAMEWAECVHHHPPPEWPEIPAPMEPERFDAVLLFVEFEEDDELGGVPPTPEEVAMIRDHIAARDRVTDASSLRDGRVGAYKFESNDGWLVTPDECEVIARAVRAHADVIAEDFFTDVGLSTSDGHAWLKKWADFNALAAAHGGYRVT